MHSRHVTLTLLVLLNLLPFQSASAGERFSDDVIELESRPGITQRILVMDTESAVATVILIPGGRGTLEIDFDLLKRGSKNLLVKTRHHYNEARFNTIVLDTPSDEREMDGDFRTSNKHLQDIEHVVDWAIKQYHVPVWVIGQSMGSISAAYSTINLPDKISGLVLNASVTEPTKIGGTPVTEMALSKISQPVFIIHHRQDGCYATPLEGTVKIETMLNNAKAVSRKILDGGSSGYGNPCYSGYHAFSDLSHEVSQATIDFIKTNLD